MDSRPAQPKLIVYVMKGNPGCERLERFLVTAGIPYVRKDVFAEAAAMEEVALRTRGRVRLPAVRIGDVLLEKQTPANLSRFLRKRDSKSP
jgi:hypothetical protein